MTFTTPDPNHRIISVDDHFTQATRAPVDSDTSSRLLDTGPFPLLAANRSTIASVQEFEEFETIAGAAPSQQQVFTAWTGYHTRARTVLNHDFGKGTPCED